MRSFEKEDKIKKKKRGIRLVYNMFIVFLKLYVINILNMNYLIYLLCIMNMLNMNYLIYLDMNKEKFLSKGIKGGI